jgi:hypothetical protein
LGVFFALSALAQGTFQDLDFEQATIVPLGNGISAASAFPGWQTLIGTTPTSVVYLDGKSAGSPLISLVNNDPSEGLAPLQGNYSAYLISASIPAARTSVTLSQTGIVPASTESIQLA